MLSTFMGRTLPPPTAQFDRRHIRIPRDVMSATWMLTAVIGGLILLLAIRTPAVAQDDDTITEHVAVLWRPGDLADAARAKALLQRLSAASIAACGGDSSTSAPLKSVAENSACHRESLRRAIQSFHNPLLTRLANATDAANTTDQD
ncbi:UrcA family protein [Acetobacter sacchari]|uniref:UrcA family protein n=1 Tax=Acetobacter sacchari TaxID=2661687 RepID=A0ABS3LXD4_9PROT|nr:UrcA family protein [Acetobacter sacchari]MBO1360575.1 UrcA family protein [Acetobacter sacchari]